MAAARAPTFRQLCPQSQPRFFYLQRRWARVHNVRFVATQHANARVTDRYKDKLEQKAKEHGLENIGDLKEAYREKINTLRKSALAPGVTSSKIHSHQSASESALPTSPVQAQSQTQPSSLSPHIKPPGVKKLFSFLDVAKVLELPPLEIETLWRLRHASNTQSLCAAIPASTFATMAESARKHPQFVLPGLPKEDAKSEDKVVEGAPIHFLQWTFPGPDTVTILFTHLAEYKLRGEFAQPHTTMTHHLELAGRKGLVLCQGNVVENRGVSVDEGRWLIMCLQKFYNTLSTEEMANGTSGEDTKFGMELKMRRRKLMEMFSRGDEGFTVEKLLNEADTLG